MNTTNNNKYRTALFQDQISAELSYNNAIKRGYKANDINIIMSDDTRKSLIDANSLLVKTETGDKSMEGLAIGGATGGAVIGILAAIAAISAPLIIPGIGLIIIGPLAAGLAGAGAGSIAGGIIGALIGVGITEEQAKVYEAGIKNGGTVLIVPTQHNDDELLIDWKQYKSSNIA